MLKIVVFDSGYGGELFADQLEEELPVAEIIRVIDWRNAEKIAKNPRAARKVARDTLRPYIGRVDLIIFANLLLSVTSLKYFQRKYKDQKFVGVKLPQVKVSTERKTAILTTRPLTRTVNYYNYLFRLKSKVETICLDAWPALIDDGELSGELASAEFQRFYNKKHYLPGEVILACGHFSDTIPVLRQVLGGNVKIHESFPDLITEVGKTLKIRGGVGKRKH